MFGVFLAHEHVAQIHLGLLKGWALPDFPLGTPTAHGAVGITRPRTERAGHEGGAQVVGGVAAGAAAALGAETAAPDTGCDLDFFSS